MVMNSKDLVETLWMHDSAIAFTNAVSTRQCLSNILSQTRIHGTGVSEGILIQMQVRGAKSWRN
jgi:hypothetical protein